MEKKKNECFVKRGSEIMMLRGMPINVEYEVYHAEVPDRNDPQGNPIDLWKVHVPQINMDYVDDTEELAFEGFKEYFEEDFIMYFAKQLAERNGGK